MQGEQEPATSSVLISNSKYLNNPYYRDVFAQFALRRHGRDLPETYLIPQMVRAVAEVTDMAEFARLIEEEKAKKPDFAAWLNERRFSAYRPDQLHQYAEGTLGAAIRAFLEKSGMEMQFMMKDQAAESDIEYTVKRRVNNHDIEHIVTGFGPYQLGESALAIMNITACANYFTPALAQHMSDHNMFVSATGYYRVSLHYPALLPHELDAMRRGITAGQALKQPFFMVQWEDYLDWKITDICDHLGFERGPGEGWAWSLEASVG
jgi:ubiquinone biosynthesis protein Coq4